MIKIGTVLAVEGNKAHVFTMDSQFVTIRRPGLYIGEQVRFSGRELVRRGRLDTTVKTFCALAATAAVFIAAVFVPGALGGALFPATAETAAVVSVDINPSVQMKLDGDCKVISAQSYNDDGTKVLSGLTLKGLSLKDAVNGIVSTSQSMGFLTDKNGVVMISAMLEDAGSSESSAYLIKLKALLTEMQASDSSGFVTLFIENQNIRDAAEKDGLSIGRELLYEYAQQHNLGLTLEDFRNGTISELLDKLGASADSLPDVLSSKPSCSSGSPEAASSKTGTPAFSPTLKASSAKSRISLAWSTLPSGSVTVDGVTHSGFKYYKIVASASPHPKYPQNGYLNVFTNIDTGSWSFAPSSGDYNKNPSLTPGQSYYFSITYVFEDGTYLYSNDVQLTMPGISSSAAASGTLTPQMNAIISGSRINVTWAAIPGSTVTCNGQTYTGFQYYKIVASATNPNPKYPDDGYLTYITDSCCSSWSFDPSSDCYNKNPSLTPGGTYYFSVTYVFSNGKIAANAVQLTIPEEDAVAFDPSMTASVSGSKIAVTWTAVPGSVVTYGGKTYSGFKYYKIVASATNPHPQYPDDGYINVISDRCCSSWSFDPSSDCYNKSPALVSGQTYYFTVTYVFSDSSGNNVCLPANDVVQITVP